MTIVELIHLSGPRAGTPWMSAWMEYADVTSWGWIKESLQRECECDGEDITIIEFGAEDGSDVVAVRGRPVAKIKLRSPRTLPAGARVS